MFSPNQIAGFFDHKYLWNETIHMSDFLQRDKYQGRIIWRVLDCSDGDEKWLMKWRGLSSAGKSVDKSLALRRKLHRLGRCWSASVIKATYHTWSSVFHNDIYLARRISRIARCMIILNIGFQAQGFHRCRLKLAINKSQSTVLKAI